MHRLVLVCCLLGLSAIPTPTQAQGSLDWHWNFDRTNYIAGPSESILLTATIFVRPESPAPFTGRLSFNFQGSLFAIYDFNCGFCQDVRLSDVNIPPGGSLQFTYGTLTPQSPIALGTYRNMPDEPLILFETHGTHHIPDTPFSIQVVPEPSTLALCFTGMLLISVKALFRRAASAKAHKEAANSGNTETNCRPGAHGAPHA